MLRNVNKQLQISKHLFVINHKTHTHPHPCLQNYMSSPQLYPYHCGSPTCAPFGDHGDPYLHTSPASDAGYTLINCVSRQCKALCNIGVSATAHQHLQRALTAGGLINLLEETELEQSLEL